MRQSSQVHLHEIGPQMDGADAFIQIVMSVKYLNVVYRCDFHGFFFFCAPVVLTTVFTFNISYCSTVYDSKFSAQVQRALL